MLHVALLFFALPMSEELLLPRVSELTPEELGIADEQDPAAAPEGKPENEDWTGAVTLGATYSDGNTNVKRGSATVDATKTREKKQKKFDLARSSMARPRPCCYPRALCRPSQAGAGRWERRSMETWAVRFSVLLTRPTVPRRMPSLDRARTSLMTRILERRV